MCPHHGRFLKKYPVKRHENSRVEYTRLDGSLLDLSDRCLYEGGYQEKYQEQLLRISKAAYYLLSNNLNHISKADVLLRYKNLLYEKDNHRSPGRCSLSHLRSSNLTEGGR